ncbi:MAG: hypothetical protein CSB46_00455 [Micrococcales bacterium]|nr:MAG: hypothetical protein CSB46_00455 [Micrococcales bacterium]
MHGGEWDELDALSKRRRLSGPEVDRLVLLYQRTATHLSQVRSAAPDATLISRLSTTLRIRWLTAVVAAAFCAVAVYYGWWVVSNPEVQTALLTEQETKELVEHDFENYYSEYAAGSFAFKVWTNNAWIAAQCVAFGITGFIPVQVLWANAVQVGLTGGIMVANGAAGKFFGLITPHGLLELTAVFTAAAAGLRLFWSAVSPGPRPRLQAVAEEGRALFTVAGGLVVVLLVSGLVEALVTPSPLPTAVRIVIGILALAAYLGYAWLFGSRAVAAGQTGDMAADQVGDYRPVAG